MKSLGERLLELRERCVAAAFEEGIPLWFEEISSDEDQAVWGPSAIDYPEEIEDFRMRYTIAIERAAVRELRKEGKL